MEHIGKEDVAWSYAATFFWVGSGLILFPFILNKMPAETVGIWNIFQTITVMVAILDFGFQPSFARNLSYIFSGVKSLRKEGVAALENARNGKEKDIEDKSVVDYGLLQGTLVAMQWLFRIISLTAFLLLATAGTAYFLYILGKYSGDRTDAIAGWILLIILNCYDLYTLYYDALLKGKGYVRRSQQIMILSQAVYVLLAIGLIYAGLGLSAIVASRIVSIVIRRTLSRRIFFTREMREALRGVEAHDSKEIMHAIYPNAVKIGLTQLGSLAVNKSAMLIGAAFLTLEEVASYGITLQLLEILCNCSTVPYRAFSPKLAQCRAKKDMAGLRHYYIICEAILLGIWIIGGSASVLFGDYALRLINSQTFFLPTAMFAVMVGFHMLEDNQVMASGFIMSDNRIPFFITSLLSGAATVLLLWLFLDVLGWGVWGMILAPGIAQLAYQDWKWPGVILKELFVGHKQGETNV
ncbi:MAG: hypothetical protein J6Y00_01460 [Paludibacteraceae bacterium]|nr:hypothetical protein [Paludibacteraceae bacterium]